MLDTYAIVEAQRALTIADDKYGTFAARLKKLQDIRRRNQRQRQMLVRELFRMAGPKAPVPADESAIRNQLTALREHDERAAVELRQAYDALDEVLDTRQQARFRMFEEQIERRKLDLLVRARARNLQKQPTVATRLGAAAGAHPTDGLFRSSLCTIAVWLYDCGQ